MAFEDELVGGFGRGFDEIAMTRYSQSNRVHDMDSGLVVVELSGLVLTGRQVTLGAVLMADPRPIHMISP